PWAPLVTIQRGNAGRPPFFCVPGAAPNVFYLHLLAQHLGPDQPFYGLQPPGFDGTTAPMQSVQTLAAYFVEAILQMQPAGPYFLAGQSAGGPTALEISLQLEAQGHEVALLIILDALPHARDIKSGHEVWEAMGGLIGYAKILRPMWEKASN